MNNKREIRYLLYLLTPYKKALSAIIIFMLASTVINLFYPLISKDIMDKGFLAGSIQVVLFLACIEFLLMTLDAILNLVKEKIRVNILCKLQYSLTNSSFIHLQRIRMSYYDSKNITEIMGNVNTDIGNITQIAQESLFFVFMQVFSLIGGFIGLFILNTQLTLLVVIFIPIKYLVTSYFTRKQERYMTEYMLKATNYSRWFGDAVGGVRDIRLFGLSEKKHEDFNKIQWELLNSRKSFELNSQWNISADGFLVQFLTMAIYIIGANLVFSLNLSVGSIFAFITYSTYAVSPITAI